MNTSIKPVAFDADLKIPQAKQITALRAIKKKIIPQSFISMDENKLTILVVEDIMLNQHVARILLEGTGYNVDIASTGKEALILYRKNSYAAILMDMDLPDISGLDVTREIRKLEAENGNNQHVLIIACTSNGLEAKDKCLSSGMDDFSNKPFEIEDLDKTIKHWINKYKK